MATKAKAPVAAQGVTKRAAARAVGKVGATTEDEVLATAHALGAALHRVGAVDAATMRDLDAL
ncbi:hypothetical protein [Roseicella aquatilis]|uniref:hypothetical protein n=1 Tax=Roseicella aquatilis TaxID=2527868 RepID=UPI001980B75F|nr:hypothetical protein [Roseicella aquatilis]